MVGQTLLHYQILEKLGTGGMGEIYKAQDTRLNRLVAIKALLATSSSDPEFRRRFIQEAQAASSLNHPNIVTIYDIISVGDDQFMVMEYVQGKTLGELIPPGGLSVPLTLQYAVQMADGLEAAHFAGIVHRDLKPGNIMVTPQGRVKILDFGLAKLTGLAGDVSLSGITQTVVTPMTVQGSIMGSVNYMSPEQAQGARIDARSDIFSFGCVLYEMLTGRRAFSGESTLLTLASVLRDEPRPIPEVIDGAPAELVDIVHRATRKDPAQRFQSMGEVLGGLTALRHAAPLPTAKPTRRIDPLPAPALAPAPPKSGAMTAIVAIVILAIAAAGAWWWTAHPAGPPAQPTQTKSVESSPESKPSALTAKPLDNQAIIEMVENKVPESIIIGHIQASATNFDLSTPEIIRLTKAGVSEAVLRSMRDPNAPVPPPEPQTRTVEVIAGLPFEIELTQGVAADCEPGQTLNFRTTRAVHVGDTEIIAKGAPVAGVVITGVHKKFLVKTAKPTFRLIEATAVDGSKIKVRASAAAPGGKMKDTPLDPIGGSKSKDAIAPAGSRFHAWVDRDQTLTVPK